MESEHTDCNARVSGDSNGVPAETAGAPATNWSDYCYFLAAARTGSLSAAARQLRVSQPTVGRRIKELERNLQVRLFDRSVEGFTLTAEGENVLELAAKMEDTSFAIERSVSGRDESLSGRVCIATTECLAVSWFARQVPELRRRYPDITPDLIVDVKAVDLLRREADIALRIGDPVSEELVGRPVTEVVFGLYAAQSYLAEHGEPEQLDDLSEHSVIESLEELAELPQARELRSLSANADISIRCNGVLNQVALARQGLGLVALPQYVAVGLTDLKRVLVEEFELRRELWLLTHRDLRDTARVKAVGRFIRDVHERDAYIFCDREET